MKIVALSGSQREKGFNNLLIEKFIEEYRGYCADVQLNVLQAGTLELAPCRVDCPQLCKQKAFQCVLKDDIQQVVSELRSADAVIIASPLYIKIPAAMNTLLERLVALAFSAETASLGPSIFDGTPCLLFAMAEYTDPKIILQHLQDVALVLKMEPIHLKSYPYLGVGGIGDIGQKPSTGPLAPFEQIKLMAKTLAKRGR